MGKVLTEHDDITFEVIGCAMAVHRALGPGYREDTYQRALEARLSKKQLSHEPQKLIQVYDTLQTNVLIGYYIPDFVVEGCVVVEIKALRGLDDDHLAQVIGYLVALNAPVGLLINFGQRMLQWKRVFPPIAPDQYRINRQWLFVPEWIA
jgi:GxxExxY protein